MQLSITTHPIWTLGDHGDTNAFLRYAAALLMQDKEWFNPEEARVMLETIVESGGITQ